MASKVPHEEGGPPSSIWGLSSLGFQPRKEEFPKNLTVNISGDSGQPGKMEGD